MWILAIAAILNLTLWWLAYQNRASEKIVTTLIVALVGALATSVAALVFSRPPSSSEQFATSLPVAVRDHTFRLVSILALDDTSAHAVHISKKANESIATLQKKNTSLFSLPYDLFGQALFGHLLQRAILERLAYTFWGSWRADRLGWLKTPHGMTSAPNLDAPGDRTVITAEEFSKLLQGNQFADLQINLGALRQLVLPPKTKVTTSPPSEFPDCRSSIGLENSFCSITIEISPLGASTGLGSFEEFPERGEWLPTESVRAESASGSFPMYSLEPVGGRLGLVSYRISVTATFNTLLSGHPEMASYKSWVDAVFASLRDEWDDQVLMKKAIERAR